MKWKIQVMVALVAAYPVLAQVTNDVVAEPVVPVVLPDEPAVVPAEPIVSPPLSLEPVVPPQEPIRVEPPPPVVDPNLRNLYLGDQGSKLGQPRGPRDLKTRRADRPERRWHGELEVGGAGYRGNTESDLLALKLEAERKTEASKLKLGGRAYVGNKDGERDRENGGADASYRHDLAGRFYYATELRYYYDALADLDYQVVGLVSLGYDLMKTERTVLSVETGPAYIVEKKGDEKKDFVAVRLAQSLERMLNERVLVWERAEYLPAVNDATVYLVIAEAGVESALSDWLRFRTALQYRFDSAPAEDKVEEDTFLSVSLVAGY